MAATSATNSIRAISWRAMAGSSWPNVDWVRMSAAAVNAQRTESIRRASQKTATGNSAVRAG